MTAPSLEERVRMLEAEVARLKARVEDNGQQPGGGGEPVPLADVPVQIAVDAAARVGQLGREREFQEMLDHTRRAVPDLRSIDVTLYDDPGDPGNPRLLITAWLNSPVEAEPTVRDGWCTWQLNTFHPAVCRWFSFNAYSWDNYGR